MRTVGHRRGLIAAFREGERTSAASQGTLFLIGEDMERLREVGAEMLEVDP